jgi:hypothetical protein
MVTELKSAWSEKGGKASQTTHLNKNSFGASYALSLRF